MCLCWHRQPARVSACHPEAVVANSSTSQLGFAVQGSCNLSIRAAVLAAGWAVLAEERRSFRGVSIQRQQPLTLWRRLHPSTNPATAGLLHQTLQHIKERKIQDPTALNPEILRRWKFAIYRLLQNEGYLSLPPNSRGHCTQVPLVGASCSLLHSYYGSASLLSLGNPNQTTWPGSRAWRHALAIRDVEATGGLPLAFQQSDEGGLCCWA